MRIFSRQNMAIEPATALPTEIKGRFTGIDWPDRLDQAGERVMRYGLVTVIGWIGAMKFTAYEAEGISGFVANSPLMGWAYDAMSQRQFSTLLGGVELGIAALIGLGPWRPRAAVAGSIAAVGMFLATLSFMITTPGVFEPASGGFPALSALPGQFLVKDIALLGISLSLLAKALRSSGARGESDRLHRMTTFLTERGHAPQPAVSARCCTRP